MMRLTTVVFVSMLAACSFGEGSGSDDDGPGQDAGPQSSPVCGDGTCASSEVNSCVADCGGGGNNSVCGDGQCNGTETMAICPSDCTGGGGGSGSGSGSNATCPADPFTECLPCILSIGPCPAGLDATACTACLTGGGGGGLGDALCEGMAADGTCNAAAGEDTTTCASDCM